MLSTLPEYFFAISAIVFIITVIIIVPNLFIERYNRKKATVPVNSINKKRQKKDTLKKKQIIASKNQ